MNTRIVVGISGKPSGAAALDWALDYAGARQFDIELVHVVDNVWDAIARDDDGRALLHAEVLLSAEHQLRSTVEQASSRAPRLRIHPTVLEGSPVARLAERSATASLLVIGTHSLGRFGNLVFSTRAARIAAHARCSVAIIPVGTAPGRGIVVGVDGSPSSRAAVEFAAAEADRVGEPLTVIFSWRVPPQWTAETVDIDWSEKPTDADRLIIAESVSGLAELYPDLPVTLDVNSSLPVDALAAAAARARLLVVGTHGRHGFTRFWLGSVSHELVLAMPCPMVVVRERDSAPED